MDTIPSGLTAILALLGSNYENKMQHLSTAEHRDGYNMYPWKDHWNSGPIVNCQPPDSISVPEKN